MLEVSTKSIANALWKTYNRQISSETEKVREEVVDSTQVFQPSRKKTCRFYCSGCSKRGVAARNCIFEPTKICPSLFKNPVLCLTSVPKKACYKQGCHGKHVEGTRSKDP